MRDAHSVLSFDDCSRWNVHVVDFAEAAVGSAGDAAGVEVCGCRGSGAFVVVDLVFVSLFWFPVYGNVSRFCSGVPYSSLRTTASEREGRSDAQSSGAGLGGSGCEFDCDGVVNALEGSHWEVGELGASYGVGKGTPR